MTTPATPPIGHEPQQTAPSGAQRPADRSELKRLQGLITRYGDAREMSGVAYQQDDISPNRLKQHDKAEQAAWDALTQALEALLARAAT